jgi:hypothetical protein
LNLNEIESDPLAQFDVNFKRARADADDYDDDDVNGRREGKERELTILSFSGAAVNPPKSNLILLASSRCVKRILRSLTQTYHS